MVRADVAVDVLEEHPEHRQRLDLAPVKLTDYRALIHGPDIRQHASAYVSIRQHASAHVSTRQHTLAYVSIR